MLAGGWAATAVLWHQVRDLARQEFRAYFEFRARDAASRLQQRLATYEQTLQGARGLFAASLRVDREEFRTYAASLRLEERYPGIQGLGYAIRVPEGERARHEATIRRQGFPDYRIHPAGPREPLTAILYLEPFEGRNLRAFGYDMFSEPVRREAMTRAWLTGSTALSGGVTLVQETDRDVQPGFLMYLPVFRNGAPADTEAARREALAGWVYAPFRMRDFMAGVLGEQAEDLDIEVRNGPGESQLLYDRAPGPVHTDLATRMDLAFGGHRWELTFRALPPLEARLRQDAPALVLVLGGLVSFLPALAVWALALGRDRALALAHSREMQVEAERLHGEEAVGGLAKGLAHDFNNLLQAILSWVDLARLHTTPGSPAAEALAHMDEGSARAQDLAERLRLLGEAGTAFDAEGPSGPLLRRAVEEALAGSEVQARFDLDPVDPPIRFHRRHLLLAFRAVALNAREAMGDRGRLEVSSRVEWTGDAEHPEHPAGACLHIAFQDEGPGIPPDLLPRIFDPYFSTKQTYQQKGLGLGLALCRIILRQHGGSVQAESEPGRGATLRLRLPLRHPEPFSPPAGPPIS